MFAQSADGSVGNGRAMDWTVKKKSLPPGEKWWKV
jgi:hypothetical protein